MKNNFQSNGSRGTFLGLSKDYGLGLPRQWKVITTTLLLLFTLSIGQMWGTDVDIELDQVRVLPAQAGLIKITGDGDTGVSSGKLNWSSNKSGTFTVSSTMSAYKIKSISFTTNRAPASFTCTAGGNVTGNDKAWSFTPTNNDPVSSATFSLGSTSSSTNVVMTVKLTTSATHTLEELKTFSNGAQAGDAYTFVTSAASTQVVAKNKANAAASSSYINMSKSSNERSITVESKSGYKLKFIALYFYESSVVPETSSVSTGTYTKANFTWEADPEEDPTTSVDILFNCKDNGHKIWKMFVGYESASSCSAPTTAFAEGAYTVGGSALALSTLISNNNSDGAISYSVKTDGGTSASISEGSFSASAAGTATITATQAADATNGKCEKIIDFDVVVSAAPSTPTHGISYTNLKGSDVSAYPTTYYEGTGIASFDPLADVTDFHFNGWSPSSIAADATTDQTISATWVAAYNVTFSYGAGGGTVPASFQKWQGAKFNLPGQGSMTAPSGKVFDGWKASGTKYAENAEYTMGNAAVEFVAQWKAVPQTIYSLTVTNTSSVNLNNGGAQNDLADDATIVGGGAYMQNDHASSTQQILGSTKLQFKAGTVTLAMTLNTALKEGDTIKATGLNSEGLCFGVTFNRSGSLDNQLASDASYFIVPEEFEGKTTLYAWRHSGSGTTCASIIIRRPADRPISSTEISLSDLKVNDRSIHSDSLAMLKTGPAYSLHLGDEFTVAPVIKFNRHKVITFADSEEPTQAIYDRAYSVTATTVSSQWQAAQEINDITYTVTATKITSYTVAYKDENGTTSLGSEVVAVGEHPTASGITAKKDYHSFAGWTLGGNPVELTGVSAEAGETVTLVASYTPAYATSVNIEQWVLDNSKNNTAFRAVLAERHYTYSNLNDLDSLTTAKNETDRNEPYLGQKWKKNNSEIGFLLKSGSTVRVKFGYVGDNVNIKIGSADAITKTAAQLETPYEYTASEDVIIKLQGTGDNTVVVKQIMIDEAIATVKLHAIVTYDAGTGSYGKANEKYTGTPLVIGDATPVTDSIFAGWYLGDDQIDATAYVPTKNVTLQAHYAPVEYAVNYSGGEDATGTMTAGAAGWGTMVTPDANAFEKTGHVFSGWEITKTSDGSATGITFSEGKFEMPKYDVTLVAQWEDNSKVAVIVETSVKYNDLAAAIEAAEPGQTVQLIQDINQEEAILIAKNLTLDLNNKTFTVTNPSSEYSNRAIKVTDGTIVIENGTVDALSNETHNGGCWGSLRQEGGHLTCNNVTFKNYRSGGLGLKPVGGTLILNECTVLSEIGGGLELGNATVEVNNCTFTQTGTDANKIYGACFGMGKMGTLTINGGTYTSDNYSFYIYTSGGTINVNSGIFAGDVKTEMNNTQYPSAVGTINISGGTFDGVGENPIVFTAVTANDHIYISGGTFDAPIENQFCAYGYVPKDNGDGTYGVTPKDGVCLIKGNVGDNTFVIDEDASLLNGTPSKNNVKSKSSTYQTLTGWKFNSRPAHLGLTLSEGTFQKGDVVEVFVTSVVDNSGANDKMRVFTANDVTKMLVEGDADMEQGANRLTLPETTTNALYLVRGSENADYDMWNPYVAYFAVYRPMMPELTAISFNDVAATKGTGNAFSVTLPEEGTNLASMTIVPTIIRNAAHATTPEAVVSNEGTWVAGENTYRVMDKDNDYTEYTITITLQGNAETPSITVQPQSQSYCAGSEPTLSVTVDEPTDGGTLSYAWFKVVANDDDEQVGSDATYTIASAGTYYVIVTNKVDGKLDASVTSENAVVTLNTPASITTQPSDLKKQIEGENITLSIVAANATGYQWYSCDNKDKENPVVISGAQSADYEFAAAAGFFYCVVNGACGDVESNVAEVTVRRSAGCQYITATSGYEATLADGLKLYACGSDGKTSTDEIFATASSDVTAVDANAVGEFNKQYIIMKFPVDVEEIAIYGTNSSDRSINSVRVKSTIGSTSADKFTDDMIVATTKTATRDVKDIYMTAVPDEQISKDDYVFINFNGGSLRVYRICYTEAIEKPVIATQPATKIDFAAGDMTATVVVNDVTEGTLEYQWYNADGDVAVDGATSATLTTTEEGTYYVIVRNTLAGHKDYAVKSDEATLAYRQANDATLNALTVSAGALDPTFDKAVVEYRVDLPKGTTTVPTLTATATMAAYGATAVVTNAAEFENYEAISTVLVTAEDHTTQKTYTVHYYVAHSITTLVDVTENTTWDWSLVTKKADGTTISGDGPKLNENEDGLILASYLSGDDFDKLEGNNGAYAIRNSSDKKVYQGASLRMHTTKGGYLKIKAADEGHTMTLNVQNAGRDMEIATLTGSQVEYTVYVQAGDVRIYNVPASGTSPMRVQKIVFTVDETPDYTRDQMLGAGVYGTICLPYNVPAGGAFGATFYEMAGRNPENGKIVMDEVTALEAGVPYVFEAHGDIINVFYGETHVENPVNKDNGMYGTFADQTLTELDDVYYFAQRALWGCADLTSLNLPANRAYVKLSEVDYLEPNSAPAPGRRRITFSVNGEQTATGIDALNAEDAPVKMMIDGKLFILRGEKLFDATGRLVK